MSDVSILRSGLSPAITTPLTRNPPDLVLVPDELENQIDVAALTLHTAKTPELRRAACDELTRLHGLRSAERVAQMETSAGLR